LLYRRGFKRRLGASGGVWQVKSRAGRAEKRLKEKVCENTTNKDHSRQISETVLEGSEKRKQIEDIRGG
jgi:hypothetical protein